MIPTTDHAKLIRYVDDYASTMDQAAENAMEARDYTDHMQWTKAEETELKRRGQPIVVDNIIADKVDLFIGLHTSTQFKPTAFPRTPQDEQSADAMAKALDFVSDASNYRQADEAAVRNLIVEGSGVLEVLANGQMIVCNHIPWDRWFYDPFSRRLDYADARYLGQLAWFDLEILKAEHGEDHKALSVNDNDSGVRQFEDQPSFWVDRTSGRVRIRVIECYWRDAKGIMCATFTRTGFLKPPERSPFVDDAGQEIWPYVAESGYITREGVRYGMVERFKTLQREHNKRRSKLLHALSSKQTIVRNGAVSEDMSDADIQRKAAQPDSVWRIDESPEDKLGGVRFERDITDISGQSALMNDTLARLENIGPNEALQGTQNASGRSLQIQQRAGTMQLGPLLNRAQSLRRRAFEHFYFRIKQFWTAPMWVRVTDSEKDSHHFIPLNQPQIVGGQVVGFQNPVAELNFDIVIEDAPDYVTLMHEQFDQLVKVAPFVQFPAEVYIESMSLRNKQDVLEKMQGATDDPRAQAEAAHRDRMAEAEVTKAEAEATEAGHKAEGAALQNVERLIGT